MVLQIEILNSKIITGLKELMEDFIETHPHTSL